MYRNKSDAKRPALIRVPTEVLLVYYLLGRESRAQSFSCFCPGAGWGNLVPVRDAKARLKVHRTLRCWRAAYPVLLAFLPQHTDNALYPARDFGSSFPATENRS